MHETSRADTEHRRSQRYHELELPETRGGNDDVVGPRGEALMMEYMQRLHHVAVFTANYAVTADFYRSAFGATVPEEPNQPSVLTFGGVTLHLFERAGIEGSWAPAHLHHFAVQTDNSAEFLAIRERLMSAGACDETVLDFGEHVSITANDPDGGMVEVLCIPQPGETLSLTLSPHRGKAEQAG